MLTLAARSLEKFGGDTLETSATTWRGTARGSRGTRGAGRRRPTGGATAATAGGGRRRRTG